MLKVLQACTADELWQQIRRELLNPDSFTIVQSRNGPTRELAHVALSLEDPRQKWIVSRSPALNPAFALVDVIWILRGRRDSGFVNYFNSQLAKHAGIGSNYHGAYGFRLRNSFAIDQLERAYSALKNNSDSRQVVLLIWDPRLDLPHQDGSGVDPDIPCNLVSMLKIRDNRLHWTQILRSNDAFLGVPHNIVQFTCLQEVMAGWLDLDVGPYSQFSDSLHAYGVDVVNLHSSSSLVVAPNSDSLSFPKEESDKWFAILEERIDFLIGHSVTEVEFDTISSKLGAPVSIENAFAIICAEAARRRKWPERVNALISRCSNPVYLQLWARWTKRLHDKKSVQ